MRHRTHAYLLHKTWIAQVNLVASKTLLSIHTTINAFRNAPALSNVEILISESDL
jgi:hypothetical protein